MAQNHTVIGIFAPVNLYAPLPTLSTKTGALRPAIFLVVTVIAARGLKEAVRSAHHIKRMVTALVTILRTQSARQCRVSRWKGVPTSIWW